LSLKVISPKLYPIAVAISVITTFTTPYQIRFADQFADWVESKINENWKRRLEGYRQLVLGARQKNILQQILRAHLPSVILNTVIVLAMTFAYKRMVHPIVLEKLGEHQWVYLLSTVGLVMLCIPFLWALTMGSSVQFDESEVGTGYRSVVTWLQGGLSFFRMFWGVFLMGFILAEFVSIQTGSLFILLGLTGLLILFGRYSEPFYKRLESGFLKNLQATGSHKPRKVEPNSLAPWDANLIQLTLSADSEFVGQSLSQISIRERFGVMVAMIERGHKVILAPGRDVVLMPQDLLFLIGTDEQIKVLKPLVEHVDESVNHVDSYGLKSFLITEQSSMTHKTIRDCGLREMIHGLVVGIERNSQRILNPDSQMVLQSGDLVWVVGDLKKIKDVLTSP
jgi:monovalent cation:H+ antiporter-2, CPA2 family